MKGTGSCRCGGYWWRTLCAATGRVPVAHAVRRYGATEQILFNFQFPCISAIWLHLTV